MKKGKIENNTLEWVAGIRDKIIEKGFGDGSMVELEQENTTSRNESNEK